MALGCIARRYGMFCNTNTAQSQLAIRTRAEYVFFIQIASLRFAVIPANVLLKLSIVKISITKTAHTANLALSSGTVPEPRAAIRDRVRSCGRKSSASSRFKGARENNLGGNYPHIPSGLWVARGLRARPECRGEGGGGLIAIHQPCSFVDD